MKAEIEIDADMIEHYVRCCRAASLRSHKGDDRFAYRGRVRHFDIAAEWGMTENLSYAYALIFEKLGWWEERNEYDSWILDAGVDAYELLSGRKWDELPSGVE